MTLEERVEQVEALLDWLMKKLGIDEEEEGSELDVLEEQHAELVQRVREWRSKK